jgi:hypothetical protein
LAPASNWADKTRIDLPMQGWTDEKKFITVEMSTWTKLAEDVVKLCKKKFRQKYLKSEV